jgi:hypothetical protein
MKPRVEPLTELGHLLLIRVSMVRPILREVIKPLVILVDAVGALLHV